MSSTFAAETTKVVLLKWIQECYINLKRMPEFPHSRLFFYTIPSHRLYTKSTQIITHKKPKLPSLYKVLIRDGL